MVEAAWRSGSGPGWRAGAPRDYHRSLRIGRAATACHDRLPDHCTYALRCTGSVPIIDPYAGV